MRVEVVWGCASATDEGLQVCGRTSLSVIWGQGEKPGRRVCAWVTVELWL